MNNPHGQETFLSVSAVAAVLEVSPSTLRSWDRRYGAGPTGRVQGSRRQYSPTDVERLRRMKRLIADGIAAGDAAVQSAGLNADEPPLSVSELLNLASRSVTELRVALEREVAREGLLDVWTRLIDPAVQEANDNVGGALPGRSVSTTIYMALLQVEDQLTCSNEVTDNRMRVTVVTWQDLSMVATVVGVTLCNEGFDVRNIAIPRRTESEGSDFLLAHIQQFDPDIVILLGRLPGAVDQFRTTLTGTRRHFLLISDVIPDFVHPALQRVRSLTGCVDEVLAIRELSAVAH